MDTILKIVPFDIHKYTYVNKCHPDEHIQIDKIDAQHSQHK